MIIYKATNKTNGKFYIGKTVQTVDERRYIHEWLALKGEKHCGYKSKFYNALRKYGVTAFVWEVIDTAATVEELNRKEQHYISQFGAIENGYNISPGGFGGDNFTNHPDKEAIREKISRANTGRKMTEEWKKHNRERQIGRVIGSDTLKKRSAALKGRTKSSEHRRKISDSLKGRTIPVDVRNRISETLTGRELSAEHKRKISESAKGRKLSSETKTKIGAASKGRKLSAETRAKMSAARKGVSKSPEHRANISRANIGKHGKKS